VFEEGSCRIVSRVYDDIKIELEIRGLHGLLKDIVFQSWGIDKTLPIIVSLIDVDAVCWMGGHVPKVKCSQSPQIDCAYSVFPQLDMILVTWIKREWAHQNEVSLLIRLNQFIIQRLPTLHLHCPICDETHPLAAPMIKPAICSRELCSFAYQELGLLSKTVDGIFGEIEITDLLLAFAKKASISPRREIIFNPFPLIYQPGKSDKLILDPNAPDYKRAEEILVATKLDIGEPIPEGEPNSKLMLEWLIRSNRSHIMKLPADRLLTSFKTPHQFVLLCASPEHEAVFSQLKAKHGSVWAFHGSRVENWHGIVRNGLKNASGSKLQVNGAVYGKGIYLSPDAQFSLQ
jgi:poly [ADP-ribose] polymerase 6/8